MPDPPLTGFIDLINCATKRDAMRHARSLTLTSEAFADFILAARLGAFLPQLQYQCHFDESVPSHLNPTRTELNAFARNGIGVLTGKALKASRKISQIFEDRRILSAHLFYSPGHQRWRLFYFYQRDIDGSRNHWKGGSHIHYASNLTDSRPLQELWNQVCDRPAKFPKSLHIRYDYHHNRQRQRPYANGA